MLDNYGREIDYLRISITDLCNLRCKYCMPMEGVKKLKHEQILTIEEIESIVIAAANCGVKKVRITGGDPLVRNGILEICRRISKINQIDEVCITTNGILLSKYAKELKTSGVNRLNISIDTLDEKKYSEITRGGDLNSVFEGIKAAKDAGFKNIKVNSVLIGGFNDNEIDEFAKFADEENVQVRFIELMPIGESKNWDEKSFVQNSSVIGKLDGYHNVGNDGVATIYKKEGKNGSIGFISPLNRHLCPKCNRMRVTSDGKLKMCLHSLEEVNLKGLSDEDIQNEMKKAIKAKPINSMINATHKSETDRYMSQIGG